MKRITSTIMTLSALALLLASCGKEPMPRKGRSQAIKLTVSGVETKASVVTTSVLESLGQFNITAFATDKWEKDVVGHSGENAAGLFTDPKGGSLQDKPVNYYSSGSSSSSTKWVISGNGDGSGISDTPAFSWINAVAMNFFAYAPVSINGTRDLKWNNVNSPYKSLPFTYTVTKSSTDDTVVSSDCDDLIFAYASNTVTYESNSTSADFGKHKSGSESFDLTFYHALAQIRFCVDPADFTNITLISAKLLGPKATSGSAGYLGIASKGDCTFTGPSTFSSWSNLANRYAYIQNFGTNGVSFASGAPTGWTASTYGTSPDIHDLYTCTGDVLLVIPQTLENCGVEVKIQEGSSEPVLLQGKLPATTSSSTDVSWDAGYYYSYKIGTTGSKEDLALTMTLVDWAERESYIPIN